MTLTCLQCGALRKLSTFLSTFFSVRSMSRRSSFCCRACLPSVGASQEPRSQCIFFFSKLCFQWLKCSTPEPRWTRPDDWDATDDRNMYVGCHVQVVHVLCFRLIGAPNAEEYMPDALHSHMHSCLHTARACIQHTHTSRIHVCVCIFFKHNPCTICVCIVSVCTLKMKMYYSFSTYGVPNLFI